MTKEQLETLRDKVFNICYRRYSQEVWFDARSGYGEIVLDQLSRIQEEQAELFDDLIEELFPEMTQDNEGEEK